MKKITVLLTSLILLSVIAPCEEGASENGIELGIRFFDRRIYYIAGDPILIQLTITNNSPFTYRFKLADDRSFSVDFDVRTVSNRRLEDADLLIRRRTEHQQVFFREMAVEPGESFSFVEDLRNYVRITDSGSFVVKASVYPELIRGNNAISSNITVAAGSGNSEAASVGLLESTRINLSVRPPVIPGPDGIPLEMDIATGAVLVRQRLAPDQVVEYMLEGRQRSQWERFFLYLDLEEMLSRDAVRQRRWNAESEEGRRRMVEQFRQELRNSTTDGTISIIPTEYTIDRTQYNNFEGTVIATLRFRNNNFTEIKRYTYYLRFKDNVWTIVDYSVMNLGTE
ncbi:MAG: hypothetical protein FWG89_03905 [Treponema sp.]|nr:hypothetical protein [Treponema sp.]